MGNTQPSAATPSPPETPGAFPLIVCYCFAYW